tara:strand:+ start:1055 stop:1303 length:249 start_codon:yes stop_codon:yes gene_type:complete
MANFSFITSSAVSAQDQSVEYKATTATAVIPGPWSSAVRGNSPTDAIQQNFNIGGLDRSIRGFLQGRRPAYNLKFPRGYYNK